MGTQINITIISFVVGCCPLILQALLQHFSVVGPLWRTFGFLQQQQYKKCMHALLAWMS
ncbi:hypothetical protein CIPAW_15G070000 [Carya illinoinensis]|uniref:Uncharacterized protein n=1 Tax=Carya illinoinensis TaxID=32201 RepID=A0A8T1NCL0_CARIL|nr:hypothetical protein CIPAW_15G070000 [Carya illinoinensis]